MNTDACNVEYINIHHNTECLSLSFVASFEDWFCLFRTWSFTLCKNDLDPNDNSDSASVWEFILLFSTMNLSVCCAFTTGLPILSSINSSDFHSWEDQVFVSIPFWEARWVCENNGSLRSIVFPNLQAQRRLTFMSGFSPGFLMQ